jgi:hypothetical protein
MKTMSAHEAKNAFGLMIDTARAEPVLIEKHGRGQVDYGQIHGLPGHYHGAKSSSSSIAARRA